MHNKSLLITNVPLNEVESIGDVSGVSFEKEEIPDGALGEPVTYSLIVTLASAATEGACIRK